MKNDYYSYLRKMGLIFIPEYWLGRLSLYGYKVQTKYFPYKLKEEYDQLLSTPITKEFIEEQMKRYNTLGGNRVWKHYFVTKIFYDNEKRYFRGLLYKDHVERDRFYVVPTEDRKEEFFVPSDAKLIIHDEEIAKRNNKFLRIALATDMTKDLPFKSQHLIYSTAYGYRCKIYKEDNSEVNIDPNSNSRPIIKRYMR